MVPVPEEHVEEAMTMILRIAARAKLRPWDQDAVTGLFHGVDEPTRSVLSAVARATAAGKAVSDSAAAESIEFTQRELLAIVREINERSGSDGFDSLIAVTSQVEVLPNGRSREQRMLSMDTDVAAYVQAAERAELAASPHPLLSEGG